MWLATMHIYWSYIVYIRKEIHLVHQHGCIALEHQHGCHVLIWNYSIREGGERGEEEGRGEEDNDCTPPLVIFVSYNFMIKKPSSYRHPGWHQVTLVQNKNQVFVLLLFLHEGFNMTGACSHWITGI